MVLPLEAQFSPIYGIAVDDFNQDGHQDILLGGNFYRAKPEIGIYDASYGLLLRGDGQNKYEVVNRSGFFVRGEVRDIETLQTPGEKLILVARNNEPLQVFRNNVYKARK